MFSAPFFKLVLFILHYAFSIFEFTCDIWVLLRSQIVQFTEKHKKSSEHSVRLKSLTKVPRHLTVLLGQEKPSYKDLAHLVIWSAASGISFVSFYDHNGILKKTESDLQYKVEKLKQKSDHVIWHSSQQDIVHKNGYTGKTIHVKVLSPGDGKSCIADVCKLLSETVESANVDIKLVDDSLRKRYTFPDPDLALCCGKSFCLYGYPPWQVRVTEFLHIKSHRNIQINYFIELLERYSKCEQRLGK